MKSSVRTITSFILVLLVAVAGFDSSVRAETPVGSNVDSRLILGFKANAAGVQAMMPEGWTSVSFPQGPLKGANVAVILIDRMIDLDRDGALKSPPTSRAVAIIGLATKNETKEVRLYVLKIYSTAPGYDPYGNARLAEISRETSTTGSANGDRVRKENWHVAPPGGGVLDLSLSYRPGKPVWSADQAQPFSNTDPSFSRIYRYDQLVQLVMSVPADKPLSGEYVFSCSIADLANVLDGSEKTVAILDVPVYVRKVSLP